MSGWWGLGLVALLIAANGMFVAAEFAMLSVRRPLIDELAEQGDRRARIVARELSQVSFALSTAQFGITATSLLVGYLAEEAVGGTLIRPLLAFVGLPESASLGLSLTLAFLLSTVTQMILGEVFPKNLAISVPLTVAKWASPFNFAFGRALSPVIRVFHNAADTLAERAFRIDVIHELEGGHSPDELARIILASGQEGSLSDEQAQLMRRAMELGELRVSSVMVPRPDIVWLEADSTLADLRDAAAATGHSRFPISGESEDDTRGSAHVKDLLRVPETDHAATPVTESATPMLVVPESQPLRRVLTDMRRQHRTFALVVDEFGGTAGMATMEDILEVLVGDVVDEYDEDDDSIRRVGPPSYAVRGSA
ncbi:MAG: hemolysin family protein, partial [Nitriliruptoraceae bacterium]